MGPALRHVDSRGAPLEDDPSGTVVFGLECDRYPVSGLKTRGVAVGGVEKHAERIRLTWSDDPGQQRALLQQLVEAGLPPMLGPAAQAYVRSDPVAAERIAAAI